MAAGVRIVRLYKHGLRWAFWRWTETPQSENYIRRLHLVKTPWFAVCLHWINRPDPEPYLHDHPVTFLSLILRGSYWEWRSRPGAFHRRWFNFIRATDAHTICWVDSPTLTLCFMGPKRQEWGYYLPQGKVYYKDYYAEKENASAAR